MNIIRVKSLAAEGRVELTKKMFKRFARQEWSLKDIMPLIQQSTVENEDVFNAPDFTFQLHLGKRAPCGDLVCVQPPDGRAVRIVGCVRPKSKPRHSSKGKS